MLKTIENLTKAFIGESQARNRYTFFSKQASKEGYDQISEIFRLTADQELEHASILYKMITELRTSTGEKFESVTVEAEAPISFGDTLENLKASIAGETHETESMYPEFANIAQKEGLTEIAIKLRAIAVAEKHHAQRYEKLAKELQGGTLFAKDEEVYRVCRKCGYLHKGKKALLKCPACGHDQGFAQIQAEEY